MTNEEATFAAYRARPDRKNLVRLLEANQHRVYNLCWHVLQQREDAEDASQQILVKILEGAGALPDARQFSLWLYRVTLNCALDVRRARARRGKLQERASGMKNHDPQTVRLYEAVHDALAKLDDELRCLIVRHHFEKRTLEELACEERCSAVAIWKRIEKGKQLLKDALAAAGWASVAAPVASYWDSLTPVHAPGGLVAKALAAKTAMGAAALGGGMVMATKGVMSATMLGAAILCLAIGTGTGIWIESKRSRSEKAPTEAIQPKAVASAHSADIAGEDPREADSERAAMRTRIAELEGMATRPSEPVKDKRQIAAEIWEQFLPIIGRGEQELDREYVIKAIARLQELDADMTPFLVERFRTGNVPKEIACSLFLALRAGGPAATALIKDVLLGADVAPLQKAIMVELLSARDTNLDGMPLDADLVDYAHRAVYSPQPRERMAAAAILGAQPVDQSLIALRKLVVSDPEPAVRAAAVRALAGAKDRTTLDVLRGIIDTEIDREVQEELAKAIRRLERHLGLTE